MSPLDTITRPKDKGQPGKNGTNGSQTVVLNRAALIDALSHEAGKAEIVQGRIVRFMATGRSPGYAGDEIFVSLRQHVRSQSLPGIAVGDNKAFLVNLPDRDSVSPDAGYYEGPNSGAKFYEGAPRFAAEVRSEHDYGITAEREMQAKRAEYFAAGTEVVWDVDVLRSEEVVRKFTKSGGPSTPVAIFKRGETADAEPGVPGFAMPVDDLFE